MGTVVDPITGEVRSGATTAGDVAKAGGALAKKTAMVSALAIAASANLLVSAANPSLATITTPASAPSLTGFTNLLPQNQGYVSVGTATTVAGSDVLTAVNITSGSALANLVPGMPLCGTGSGQFASPNIPLGCLVKSVDSVAGTITLSKPAIGSASAVPFGAFTNRVKLIGGALGTFNTYAAVVGASINSGGTPGSYGMQAYAIEFYTDVADFTTSAVGIWISSNQNGTNPNAFRIAIDDVYVSDKPSLYGAGAEAYVGIQFATKGIHKVRFEFQALRPIMKLFVRTGARIWATPPSPIQALFFGDSLLSGGATWSWQMHNMAHQLALMLGWDINNASVPGTGYTNNGGSNFNWASPYRLRDLQNFARTPDVGIFSGSVNDYYASSATIQANALAVWREFRRLYPSAPIIIFGCPSTGAGGSAAAIAVEQALATAFTTLADTNSWWFPMTTDQDGAWVVQGVNDAYAGGGVTSLSAFTGEATGTTLTVTAMTKGTILLGQTVVGGVTGSPKVIAFGTGNGQTGTYTLDVSQGTVASQAMTSGDNTHPSDYPGVVDGNGYFAKLMAQKIKNVVIPALNA